MKTFLLHIFTRLTAAALLIFATLPALAQKATVRDGVILRDGQPYARIQASGSILFNRDYSFKTLDGEEFMMMHYDDAADDYRVVFLPGEEQTRLPKRYGSAGVMAQEIVDNNLVEDGAFNRAGLKRFMLAHPAPTATAGPRAKSTAAPSAKGTATTKSKGNTGEKTTSETMSDLDEEVEKAADDVSEAVLNIGSAIERAFEKDSIRRAERRVQPREPRNRAAAITVSGNKLEQDGQLIGTYTVKSEPKAGTAQRMYAIYSATDGDLVAEAITTDAKPSSAELVTPQDNRLETLRLEGSTQSAQLAEIARWLVKHRYL